MAKSPNRLGKGLNALITPRKDRSATPSLPTKPDTDATPLPNITRELPVDQINANPRQPRTDFDDHALAELADSIRKNGVIQPIVVRQLDSDRYELVAGERRLRAARRAELQTIPAIVRDLSDAQSFELALVENLQREDLGPLERAGAYQQYLDTFGCSIDELAQRLSESRGNVSNYLRLLKLQPEVCFLLGTGDLGMGQARALAAVSNPQRQLALAKLVARRNLSVRQVEDLVRADEDEPDRQPAEKTPDGQKTHQQDVERALSKAVGLRVRLMPGRKKNAGRIVIYYNNLDDFDRISETLGGDLRIE